MVEIITIQAALWLLFDIRSDLRFYFYNFEDILCLSLNCLRMIKKSRKPVVLALKSKFIGHSSRSRVSSSNVTSVGLAVAISICLLKQKDCYVRQRIAFTFSFTFFGRRRSLFINIWKNRSKVKKLWSRCAREHSIDLFIRCNCSDYTSAFIKWKIFANEIRCICELKDCSVTRRHIFVNKSIPE